MERSAPEWTAYHRLPRLLLGELLTRSVRHRACESSPNVSMSHRAPTTTSSRRWDTVSWRPAAGALDASPVINQHDAAEQHQSGQSRPGRAVDRMISATCEIHGARGFCNLRVMRRADGGIVLDPHVSGSCVIALDGIGGAELRDALVEWLGWKGRR